MPRLGEFDNTAEFMRFEQQMKDTIQNQRWRNHTLSDMDEEEIADRLLPWLDDSHRNDPADSRVSLQSLYRHVRDTGELPPANLVKEFWYGVSVLYEPSLTWGFWSADLVLLKDKESDEWIGYSSGDKLITSQLLTTSSIIQHIYSDYPDPVNWTLLPQSVNQGSDLGLVAYVGIANFDEIEAVSQVPWIDPGLSSEDFANNVLDNRMKTQWQRKIDARRIVAIRTFAESANNTMFNPITLYVPPEHLSGDDPIVSFERGSGGLASVRINFDFLYGRPGSYRDFVIRPDPGQDQRPLWLVDGQHRTRGFGSSVRGSRLEVPIVLLMDDEGYEGDTKDLIARVFTEINTGASPLEKLHKLFLKYSFNMPSDSPSDHWENYDDRGDLEDVGRSMIRGSWANRRAYESALMIATDEESPLKDCIQFQKPAGQRASHHLVSSSSIWVENTRDWFLPGNIYSPISRFEDELDLEEEFRGMNEIDGFHNQEILNYLCAFRDICNRLRFDLWATGSNKRKQLFQFMGPFPALLMVYPFVVRRIIGSNESSRPISQDQFEEALAPLTNVDWRHPRVRSILGGRTNTNRKHLAEWIKRAIDAETVESEEDILDQDIRGEPGKGLISKPADAEIVRESQNDWPEDGRPLVIRMEMPPNALSEVWTVRYYVPGRDVWESLPKAREGYKSRRVSWEMGGIPTGEEPYAELTIEFGNVRNHPILKISGCWKNAVGDGGESEELVFNNPEFSGY